MNQIASLKDSISIRAFTILVIFFTIGTSILIAPASLAVHAKQDAWLSCLIGMAADLALVGLYILLGERYPGLTIVQSSKLLLGRWAGGAAGLLFTAFCYLLTSLLVGDLGYFLSTQIMSDTPLEALMIVFVAAVGATVRQGMRTYSRTAEVLFPWILLLLLILIFPLLGRFDVQNLEPFLEFGIPPVLKGASAFAMFQEMAVLLFLYPFVNKGKGRGRGFLAGTAIGGLVLIIITLGALVVLQVELTQNHLYPAYALAKNIHLGHMLERIEGLMMFIWICSIFFKTVLTLHASVIGVNQTLGIRDGKLLVWPLAVGLIPLALACYSNVVFIQYFLSKYWAVFAFPFLVLFPLLLLIVSFIRHGRSTAGYDRKPGRPS